MDAYAGLRELVAGTVATWKTGTVTLTRTTRAPADPETPSTPGAATTEVYELDAVVKGVSEQYINETTILATDLMVVASPQARRASDGVVVQIDPQMSDVLTIDGAAKVIKAIKPSPAAGDPAVFRIFVAS